MTETRPYTRLIDRLKASGLRPTRQRLALAKLLFEAPGAEAAAPARAQDLTQDSGHGAAHEQAHGHNRHVTAEQLHGEAMAADVRVSLATVYNTLHQFTEAGLLREVVVDSGRSYFDTNIDDHHHFYFEGSGRLQDIPGDNVRLAEIPEAPAGAEIERVDVIIRLRDR
jgi:Fur family iron response transcriptional regulator